MQLARIAVVSDTHGHLLNTRAAIRQLRELNVQRLVHCGDIGSIEVVMACSEWPADFVFGNVDRNVDELADAIVSHGGTSHGLCGVIKDGKDQIAMMHGHEKKRLASLVNSQEYDWVLTGHTHVQELRTVGRTSLLNPGALYRARPKSFAILDTRLESVEFIELSI